MTRMFYVLAMSVVITASTPFPTWAGERQEAGAAAAANEPKIGQEVRCAIDGMKMRLEADTPSLQYQGKTYYFCADTEKQTFLKDPERYSKP